MSDYLLGVATPFALWMIWELLRPVVRAITAYARNDKSSGGWFSIFEWTCDECGSRRSSRPVAAWIPDLLVYRLVQCHIRYEHDHYRPEDAAA